MKKNQMITLLSLFILICGLSTIYAEDATVGSSTFTLPDGYTVNQTNESVTMLTGENSVIVIYEGDVINLEDAKQARIDAGYEFIGEDTYDCDGISLNQQNFKKDNINACIYTFNKDNKNYIIVFTIPEGQEIPSYEANPVTGIIDSLE
ncbi:MAG: hypothetical protein BZ137_01580 [Methanosphaera sp. rholeuAM130]|nr:MAG: hypothetical protein BZ137_01580 [Methanosphaera sp. rholeuAM130]